MHHSMFRGMLHAQRVATVPTCRKGAASSLRLRLHTASPDQVARAVKLGRHARLHDVNAPGLVLGSKQPKQRNLSENSSYSPAVKPCVESGPGMPLAAMRTQRTGSTHLWAVQSAYMPEQSFPGCLKCVMEAASRVTALISASHTQCAEHAPCVHGTAACTDGGVHTGSRRASFHVQGHAPHIACGYGAQLADRVLLRLCICGCTLLRPIKSIDCLPWLWWRGKAPAAKRTVPQVCSLRDL